jgi:hypothetical protein
MSRSVVALVVALAASPLAAQAQAPAAPDPAAAQAPAPEAAAPEAAAPEATAPGAAAPGAAAPATTVPVSISIPPAMASGAKVWIGKYDEYEQYIKTASIDREKDIPVGVTHPKHAFFTPGGLAEGVAVKNLGTGVRGGFWESYKSEIAAYEMDRLLGMDMVPPTVERRVHGDLVSVQLWVNGCKLLKDLDQRKVPHPLDWAKQVCRQRVFDNLIANIDRNAGNLLVDDQWNLILIDHSRAFASDRMPFEKEMTRIDKEFFAKMKALDEPTLMKRIRPLVLSDSQVRAILKRRDKLVADFERLAQQRGEVAVFPF